ncbi:uncharacterized protein LOC129284002 [Lytechinus pictus]|uniref:uncharacterized protein LOC129284002 n=1 Tax=Lytechinus pictus TaxID=7653 RepID=UPI0030BA1F10
MAPWLYQLISSVPLLCIVGLTLGYVPVNERPVRIPDRTRPIDRPSPISRYPSRPLSHQPGPSIRSTSTSNFPFLVMAGVNRRLDALEVRNADTEREVDELSVTISEVQDQIEELHTRMSEEHPPQPQAFSELRSANVDLETRVSKLEAENDELRVFLVSFEQFFNRLMSADPAAYDPSDSPPRRLSRLHQYLGNAEAELIDVSRPTLLTSPNVDDVIEQDNVDDVPTTGKIPEVIDHWETVQISVARNQNATGSLNPARKGTPSKVAPRPAPDMTMSSQGVASSRVSPDRGSGVHLSTLEADRLAVALEQLETRNQELTTRLQTLERKSSDEGAFTSQAFGTSSKVNANAVTEELLNKVEILEQVVALQASSLLDDTPTADAVRPRDPGAITGSKVLSARDSSGDGATGRRVSSTSMKQEDVDIMQGVLQEARRSGSSSSRKSAFSVARTTSLLGSNSHQQVEFDHVFVNKGRDFAQRNSTFICERPGYYFITFHLRSYDGLYLGVSLMKNDEIVSAIFTDAHQRNVMEGQSVILHLEPGDALYLLLGPSPDFGLHSNNRKYVTFSGFMIYGGY